MFGNLNGWHLVILIAVVLLLFGAPKLPGLARSVGQSMRIFRSEVKTMKDENGDTVDPVDPTDTTEDDVPAAAAATPSKAPTKPAVSKPAVSKPAVSKPAAGKSTTKPKS